MEKTFNTKNSMTYFKKLGIAFALGGIALGGYAWYRSSQLTSMIYFTIFGAGAGLVMYWQMMLKYGKTTYTITGDEIIKKHDERVVESIKTCEAEYYYIKKPETFLRVKLRNGKDFAFPMTLGFDADIASALEAVGIRAK